MAIFAQTYLPILIVLQNDGSINLRELTEKLNSESPRHFEDMAGVEWVIKTYSGCLKIVEGDRVIFNRQAKSYTKNDYSEREINVLLHDHIPNMHRFELYPYITPKTSLTCPIGATWKYIPRDEIAVRNGRDAYVGCNYSPISKKCNLGCDVKREKIVRLGIADRII